MLKKKTIDLEYMINYLSKKNLSSLEIRKRINKSGIISKHAVPSLKVCKGILNT